MRKILILITSLRVKIKLTLEGTFIGQFLKGCNIGPIKKFNRGKLRNYFAIVLYGAPKATLLLYVPL